jgi:hypothetical protein
MRKILIVSMAILCSFSVFAQQSMLGGLADKAKSSNMADLVSGPSITGLLGNLTGNLDVSPDQAQGGLASIMNYAKDNLSADDFSTIAEQIPGTDSILKQLPDLGGVSSGGMGSLLSKAAEYSDQLGGTALLAQQFESLGLDPDMIMGFVSQISSYLDTPEGQKAKELLMSSLGDLSF